MLQQQAAKVETNDHKIWIERERLTIGFRRVLGLAEFVISQAQEVPSLRSFIEHRDGPLQLRQGRCGLVGVEQTLAFVQRLRPGRRAGREQQRRAREQENLFPSRDPI